MLKHVLFLLAIFCALNTGEFLYAKSTRAKNVCGRNKEDCLNNNDCQCYCAFKGAPRDKKPEDKPIYIENDPYGHHCYCNQRDLDKEIADHKGEVSIKKSTKTINSYR
jgi:hypothetical protein